MTVMFVWDGWFAAMHVDDVAKIWPQAADLTHDELDPLLASARVQCEAYAPSLYVTLEDGTTALQSPPPNYQHAQILQARALYRAMIAGDRDGIGADGYTVTVFPMDWTVKNLLRPKKGRPVLR